MLRAAVVLAGAVLYSLLVLTAGQGPAGAGPCSTALTTLDFTLPASSDCGWRCSGVLYVHSPEVGPDSSACAATAPYPLVVFISGFLAAAADYFAYSSHLASWGIAVLQYDFNLLASAGSSFLHTDAAEVGFLSHFLDVLKAADGDPASLLRGQLNFTTMGAAGHSRGGKIAALHFAGATPNVRAVFLLDPVDGSTSTASEPGYPSAIEALRGQNKLIGIAGAGRIGPCNGAPYATGNWSDFWDVAGPGSWLELVPDAGHLQFADISSVLDLLCCRGCQGLISHKEGINLAKVPMAAWFRKQLRPHAVLSSSSTSSSTSSSSNTRSEVTQETAMLPKLLSKLGGTVGVQAAGYSANLDPKQGARLDSASSRDERTRGGVSRLTDRFRDWVCREEGVGKIRFIVKGVGDVCAEQVSLA